MLVQALQRYQILVNTKCDLEGADILKLSKVNTTAYGLKSWRYLAPRLWSLLPESHRIVGTFKAFKNNMKKINLLGF